MSENSGASGFPDESPEDLSVERFLEPTGATLKEFHGLLERLAPHAAREEVRSAMFEVGLVAEKISHSIEVSCSERQWIDPDGELDDYQPALWVTFRSAGRQQRVSPDTSLAPEEEKHLYARVQTLALILERGERYEDATWLRDAYKTAVAKGGAEPSCISELLDAAPAGARRSVAADYTICNRKFSNGTTIARLDWYSHREGGSPREIGVQDMEVTDPNGVTYVYSDEDGMPGFKTSSEQSMKRIVEILQVAINGDEV